MEKLKCVFIGNCQNNALIHFLNKSDEFKEKYYTVNYTNYQLIRDNASIPVDDIKSADVVILQPLPPVHVPSDRFPIHKSIINDLNLNYGEEYIKNSEDFYLNRILTYINMNKF